MNTEGNNQRRILVVDDEPSVCRAIRLLLEFDGHAVEVADNGAAALELLAKNSFDLVLTDYSMPDMKGDELCTRIKQRLPAQRIIMITAFGSELKASRKMQGLADNLIDKPFSFTDLREAIHRVFASGP